MSVTLKQLEILNAVVVAGSISKATRWVKLSQPTISQQIAKMEETLGTQLIIRARGPSLKLTPAGEYWFRSSCDILARVEAVESVHESHFREDRMAIRLGTTPSLRGRFIGAAAKLAVAQKKFSRFEFIWGLNSADVVKQMTLHQINCGVVSESSIEDQTASLHSVRLFDDRVVWVVPQSIPHSAIEEVLASRDPPTPRLEALTRFVDVGGGVPWHDGTNNWYRAHLPYAMPYFGCLTHKGAVEFVAAGLATCHAPLSLMPSLPETLRRELRIYNLREFRRTAVFIMPRHLLSLRPFAEFQEQLCDFAIRDYQHAMNSADVPDVPLAGPAVDGTAPAVARCVPEAGTADLEKPILNIGPCDANSRSNAVQKDNLREGKPKMLLPADRRAGP